MRQTKATDRALSHGHNRLVVDGCRYSDDRYCGTNTFDDEAMNCERQMQFAIYFCGIIAVVCDFVER